MSATTTPANSLAILSIEDEPTTIEGPLDTLDFDGHRIDRADTPERAERCLREQHYDLLLVDQRLGGPALYDAGSDLILNLKEGKFGAPNEETPFLFVTGSEAWVPRKIMASLKGFKGIVLKGGAVTPVLREICAEIQPSGGRTPLGPPDRVLVRLVARHADTIEAVIPSWSLDEPVMFSEDLLPAESPNEIEGLRLFGWTDLGVATADELPLVDLELAPRLNPDDDIS